MVGGKKLLPPAATQKAACNALITTSNNFSRADFRGLREKITSLLMDEVHEGLGDSPALNGPGP